MTTFYGISSDSVGTLFSSLSTSSKSSNTTSIFSSSNLLSDYYSIKNGSYKKLLNAYYAKYGTESTSQAVASNTISKDSTTQLATIKSSSDKLSDSVAALTQSGSKSLFKEAEQKDADGNVSMGYDTDKIYQNVKSFVDNYNDVIKAANNSSVSSVSRARTSMVSATATNEKMLKEMGITINENKTLSIDEETFKKADMLDVKSMFQSAGSYGYMIAARASQMNAAAAFEATKTNTYTSVGTYTSALSSGSLYDSLY